jgi:hypothetical protein
MERKNAPGPNAPLTQLNIRAVLTYIRPIPGYLNIESRHEIMGFVHGHCKPEDEFREFEAFRKTLVTLADEGLLHPEECEKVELPRIQLILKAGEDEMKPFLDLDVVIQKESWEAEIWSMEWSDTEGHSPRVVFFERKKALVWLKNLLDKTTSKWASRVEFTG